MVEFADVVVIYDFVAIALRLPLEQLEAWHTHDPRRHLLRGELLLRLDDDLDLGAAREQDDLGLAPLRLRQDVRPSGDP